jgi:hypothetical protein
MLRRIPTLSVTEYASQVSRELLQVTDRKELRRAIQSVCDAIDEQQHWTLYDYRDFWMMLRDNIGAVVDSNGGGHLYRYLKRLLDEIDTLEYKSWCKKLIDGVETDDEWMKGG